MLASQAGPKSRKKQNVGGAEKYGDNVEERKTKLGNF